MKLLVFSLIFFSLFSLSHPVEAQWVSDPEFDSHAQKGIDYTYNLDFDAATREFKELIKLQPEHPAGHFFLAMVDWWRILLELEDESRDEEFINKLDKVIEMCDARLKKDENDLTALFFKGGAIGFRGRLRANRGSWLKAANDGRRALGIVKKASELAPENHDILLGTGIYNYYAEVAPQRYPLLKPLMWFLPKGDKLKGIEQLRLCSEHAKYARTEAAYFLMQLYFFFEKDYWNVLQLAAQLHRRYPNNSLFHRYLGRAYVAINRMEDAKVIFTEVLKRHDESRPGYNKASAREAYYYLGMYELNFGKPEEALKLFTLAERLSQDLDKGAVSGFRVMANLRIGMAYDLLKKRNEAVQSYRRVLAMNEYEDSHKLAKQYIQTPYSAY